MVSGALLGIQHLSPSKIIIFTFINWKPYTYNNQHPRIPNINVNSILETEAITFQMIKIIISTSINWKPYNNQDPRIPNINVNSILETAGITFQHSKIKISTSIN